MSRNIKEYYELLNKRIKHLQDIVFNFKSKRLAMINKERGFFQYKGGDLVYIISPLTSQLCTVSCKVAIKYVGPVVIYKIIDPPQLLSYDLRWKKFKRTLQAQEVKAHYHKGQIKEMAKI